jgi:hypothetical protein
MLILAPIVFAVTVSLPAIPPQQIAYRPLNPDMATLAGPIQIITVSAPAQLLGTRVELSWTDDVAEPVVISRAIGPCSNVRARFVTLETVAMGEGSSWVDTTGVPGDTYCWSANGSRQQATVPTLGGVVVVNPPPIVR